jgi:hypothetical protein
MNHICAYLILVDILTNLKIIFFLASLGDIIVKSFLAPYCIFYPQVKGKILTYNR